MNVMIFAEFMFALISQTNLAFIRSWSISPELRPSFEGLITFDNQAPFKPSLEDFPGAIGFIFNKPVYPLDDDLTHTLLMMVHLSSELIFIDTHQRVSRTWSN